MSNNPYLEKILTPTDFTVKVNTFFMNIIRCSLLIGVLVVAFYIFLKMKKYSNADFKASVMVQSALKKEMNTESPSPVLVKCNWLVKRLTVSYSGSKVVITIPTKFWWQISPHVDLSQEIYERLISNAFKAFLASYFEGYSFSAPIHRNGYYLILGESY